MKKLFLISIISSLLSFHALANENKTMNVNTNINPEQLCKEFQDGNSSLVLRKYKGKVIKDSGKVSVFYSDGNGRTLPFITLSIYSKKKTIDLSGYKSIENENENAYLNLDGKTKTISVKIEEIESQYSLGNNECTISGELIEY